MNYTNDEKMSIIYDAWCELEKIITNIKDLRINLDYKFVSYGCEMRSILHHEITYMAGVEKINSLRKEREQKQDESRSVTLDKVPEWITTQFDPDRHPIE